MVGFERPPKRNQWHDEECRGASAAKNDLYKRTLQSAATRVIADDYRQKRREERRHIRPKRDQERRECDEIEMYRSRNDAQKFFKNVKSLTEGFKPSASFCRDERGNLVTDAQRVLRFNCTLFYCKATATLVLILEKTANRHQSTTTG